MQKIESLNNITHENLAVNPEFSAELGDNAVSTVTFITEFSEVQKEYPILCRKDPETGEYQAVVLFGFQKDENLFLVEADPSSQKYVGWRAEYIPAAVARGPFSIGVQGDADGSSEAPKPVVHIDMAHPKASCDRGRALFLENGGHSPYLNYITNVLDTINEGMHLTKHMFNTLNKYELIEPVNLDIEFIDKSKLTINQFETINTEKLSQLSGEALAELNKSGFLQAAYYMATSMSNIRKLIDWKNRNLSASGNAN
ncbi:SapC family protein [Gilvimarinus xylanilyticus]|uniref:SapC family protein n=1 Tax=Gilvimarinus xylanilyticus TaxID=2944139 RepID=A0A9X2HW81_9GAMM|nr:SapC family protein [Gilvimarinus xylanilyticus]MCP8898149.1 SapC family protein [Gilvimarinus xylanilyticus]